MRFSSELNKRDKLEFNFFFKSVITSRLSIENIAK